MSKLNLSPDLISDEIRNSESVEKLKDASVLLANIAAELSLKLPEKDFSKVRERIVETVSFIGEELFPLVTPEVATPVVPKVTPKIEGVTPDAAPDVTPVPPKKTRGMDPAVARVLAGLPPGVHEATGLKVSAADVSAALVKDTDVVVPPKSAVAKVVAPAVVPQENNREAVRAKARAADPTLIPVGIKLDIDKYEEEIHQYAGEEASNYEKAVIVAELWAKDVGDDDDA
jgi:hypothetical protein